MWYDVVVSSYEYSLIIALDSCCPDVLWNDVQLL